jgi:hypothetical protein
MLDGHDSHNSFSLGEWGASSIPSTALNTCRVLMHPKNPSAKVVSRVFASARIDVNCASINFFFLMSIKSDKTFEEIVERLVALFRPQAESSVDAAHAVAFSAEVTQNMPPDPTPPSSDQDDTQN